MKVQTCQQIKLDYSITFYYKYCLEKNPRFSVISTIQSCQTISNSVGFTKTRAFPTKSFQNCANQLCRNNISRALPENKICCIFFPSKFLEKFFRRLCHTPDSPALSCFVHEAIMNSANAQYSGEHFLLDESSGGAWLFHDKTGRVSAWIARHVEIPHHGFSVLSSCLLYIPWLSLEHGHCLVPGIR